MTLVITAIAAVIVSVLRLARPVIGRRLHLGVLALIYCGAAIMWLVDAIISVIGGGPFVSTDPADLKSDSLLGACVVVLGLIAWAVYAVVTRRRTN